MARPIVCVESLENDHQNEIEEVAQKAIENLMDSIPYTSPSHLKRLGRAIIEKSERLILYDRDKLDGKNITNAAQKASKFVPSYCKNGIEHFCDPTPVEGGSN